MRRYVLALLFGALIFTISPTVSTPVSACDALCLAQKKAGIVKRFNVNYRIICVDFMQGYPQNVVVSFYDDKGKLKYRLPYAAKERDNFCLSPVHFAGVHTIEICNDGHSAWIISEQIKFVLQRGRTPAPLCLLGSEGCKRMRKVG